MKLCLYGAGNTGKQFVEKRMREYIRKYTGIFFIDNNSELRGTFLNEYEVKDMDFVDSNTEIIITSACWKEIYQDCCLKKYCVQGIYDKKCDKVFSYKEMCRVNWCIYKNDRYIYYLEKKKQEIDFRVDNFLYSGRVFENISEVALMLSNLCNYAYIHKKCPASCIKQKEILSSEAVFGVFNDLEKIRFEGTICFHIYNEPLMDPRLFWFIDYIKNKMPNSNVKIYSNGYYLNEQMIEELQNIGVDILEVTGYGELEYNRLLDLRTHMAYSVLYGNLDDRLDLYNDRKDAISVDPCKTYFTQVCIYSNGDVGLCCLDYQHPYNLPNIYRTSLKEAMIFIRSAGLSAL